MRRLPLLLLTLALLSACRQAQVPPTYTDSKSLPDIYPDYTNVTVPANIAPLRFQLMSQADDVVTRFTGGGSEIVCGGRKAMPDEDDWRDMVGKCNNADITVEVYAEKDGQWTRFKPFAIHVSADPIDPWLSYRLISPSYVAFEELTISQRCLENFDESIVYDNMLCSTEAEGQCINCHNYQRGNPNKMQFHARLANGGTLINLDGNIFKTNLKTDSTLSAGVYPAWHPTRNLIAYSTNITRQMFHTRDLNKIEVFDSESDLILYDADHGDVRTIENRSDEFEVFPCWSPDGKYLYYSSAHFVAQDTIDDGSISAMSSVVNHYKDIKYNIYRKAFDNNTLTFGPRELVFDAAAQGLSATLPRLSPDGRWLLLSVGEWGCFHIWHRDADLWLMDLSAETPSAAPLKAVNSPDVEAYHTWSTNGRWIVFSSRRSDGNFTRPFFAHIDANGKATKPFELPSADPDYHRQLMKSYNIPELMTGPVTVTPQQFADVLKTDARPATFVSNND